MIIYGDPDLTDEEARAALYAGDLVMHTGLAAVTQLVEFAREQLATLFAPHDPQLAHEHHTPAELAALLGAWKPRFIHHETSKRLVRQIIQQAGFPPGHTYYDVPKPRTAFPAGHLNTGVAFAFPWHRDVWYSAPAQQVNWWLPIFPVRPTNAMSFDPASFARAVPNDSETFDYYRHNASRKATAAQVSRETRALPGAAGHQPDGEVIVLPPPGAVLLFSGAQLHTTIPNTSGRARYSIDFRTVDDRDLAAGEGAPLVDVRCGGTAIRDFHRVADGAAFDERTVVGLFGAPPPDAHLVFSPNAR
nr:hypothetical protein GCM10020063_010310 [Dactylosporangium thailandense]